MCGSFVWNHPTADLLLVVIDSNHSASKSLELHSFGRAPEFEALAFSILWHMSTLPNLTAVTTEPESIVEKSTKHITRRYMKGSRPARVTRISIESSVNDEVEVSKPRLKQGVYISQPQPDEEKSLIIASAHHAISIHHPGARAIIAKFDGQHCAIDISNEIDAPLDVVEKVISELEITQLLDVAHSKIRLHNRFQSPIAERAANTDDQSNDASFKQLQLRMSPELSQTTWIPGVVDGGVQALSSRQSFGVEIYGESRLATLIYAALLASGVSNTKFSIASNRVMNSIGDNDLGTGVLRISDFGLNYKSRIEELTREWSLFPTASKNVKGSISAPIPENNVRVIVGDYTPQLIEQLMRDRMDHLFVGTVFGGAAYAGPLVKPGKTPCVQCLEIGKAERYGAEHLIPVAAHNLEIPVAISYQIAGTIVQAILQLIDTGICELTGAQLCFDYTTPVHKEPVRFARHPQCQCQWN